MNCARKRYNERILPVTKPDMKKKILIINTGGTISSVKTENGYAPAANYVQMAMSKIPALSMDAMPAYDLKEYSPMLDSSNMRVKDWNQIARDIADNYQQYDGFVVFHGTDTMAYTASALSFMLENLAKPVIITGSQIPLSQARNDAADNIITSLWLCANQPIHEVCIYFSQCLLRGNRTQKISAQDFRAFDSPNYPHLAAIGIDIQLHKKYALPKPEHAFQYHPIEPSFIANFRLFPGFSDEVLQYILAQPIKGLILETYGAGNAQNQNSWFLDILKEACERGVVIVNCTQCHHGRVEMDKYATGQTLRQAGLISGYDMTPEAAHCKLLYLLSRHGDDVPAIKAAMAVSLAGELSH